VQTLGVGIIGFGFMGKVHAHSYRSVPFYYDPAPIRTKLIGVADLKGKQALGGAGSDEFEFFTTDFRDLLSRDDIHIIDICSPNSLHTEQLLATMAAGKHIYCDKPLAVGEADLDRVEAALRSRWKKALRGKSQGAGLFHLALRNPSGSWENSAETRSVQQRRPKIEILMAAASKISPKRSCPASPGNANRGNFRVPQNRRRRLRILQVAHHRMICCVDSTASSMPWEQQKLQHNLPDSALPPEGLPPTDLSSQNN
jgi:hypothetical protein